MAQRPRATSTSSFGVSRRESHDSSSFYERFTAPVVARDDDICAPAPESIDRIHLGDARSMDAVADASVALVVTSPPYFAGKEYEQALGQGIVPATYLDYLELLCDVFSESVKKLEPGGRIAVNVANLGRKPYRSLSADVISILQDRLGLLLRGEIVWVKGKGASNSCAWGSFQSAANPVLRDLTERVLVASKGRFDRAVSRRAREERGLPSEVSIFKDEFMEATTDVWELATESATRVGHPAPFPVELPQRLIELYTYRGDLVLDPFIGSGSTAVAAVRTERCFVGYDTDPHYVEMARTRVARERRRLATSGERPPRVAVPLGQASDLDETASHRRALREGRNVREIARALLEHCKFEIVAEGERIGGGAEVDFVAKDTGGEPWRFLVAGAFTTGGGGLHRMDTLWRTLGKASVIASVDDVPLVVVTTDLPAPGSPGDAALRATRGKLYVDALELLSSQAEQRLLEYARRSRPHDLS